MSAENEQENAGITIYSKDDCGACDLTQRKLNEAGINFKIVELEKLSDEELQAFRDQGLMQAPIVVSDQGTFAGFRPDRVKAIITAHEAPAAAEPPPTHVMVDGVVAAQARRFDATGSVDRDAVQTSARVSPAQLEDLPLEGLSEVLTERVVSGFMTLRRAASISPTDLMAVNKAIEPGVRDLSSQAQTRATVTAWEFASNTRPFKSAVAEWHRVAPGASQAEVRSLLSRATGALKPSRTLPNKPPAITAKRQGPALS